MSSESMRRCGLADAPVGCPLRVVAVEAAPEAAVSATRLADLGFVVGEPVTVLRRAWPGGEPLQVRVGDSLYAMRRAEAAAVRVAVDGDGDGDGDGEAGAGRSS